MGTGPCRGGASSINTYCTEWETGSGGEAACPAFMARERSQERGAEIWCGMQDAKMAHDSHPNPGAHAPYNPRPKSWVAYENDGIPLPWLGDFELIKRELFKVGLI